MTWRDCKKSVIALVVKVVEYYRRVHNKLKRISHLSEPPSLLLSDYQIIPDKPVETNSDEKVRFGHDKIANVIIDIFSKVEPPFTLGLFGGWGIGKSTIINRVVDNLKGTKIRTVIFDVWKYDDDSLRRQLLIKLDEDLKLHNKFKETLNQSLSIPQNLSIRVGLKLALSKTLYSLPIFLLLGLFWVLLKFNIIEWGFINQIKLWLIDTVGKVALYGVPLAFLTNWIQSIAQPGTSTTQKSATDSAEGFEDRFENEIVNKLHHGEKLLVIIDNLDRTTHEKSLALLSDIKTFFSKESEKSRVLFLIACDENAVRNQIRKNHFGSPSEYLRKFFNATISIPRYLGEELDDYTQEKLEQTKIADIYKNNDLVWLITYTYRNNPREIKQVINTLTVNYLLAKEMEDKGDIAEKGIVTKHVEQLAKLLIIKQRYPNEYKRLEKLSLYSFLEWEDVEADPEILINNPKKISLNKKQEFSNFIKDTRHIKISNLLLLVRLRQSEQEKKYPGLSAFFSYAEDGKKEIARKVFNKMAIKNYSDFDTALKNEVARLTMARVPSLINLTSIVVNCLGNNTKKCRKFVNQVGLSFPSGKALNPQFHTLNPEMVFRYIYPFLDTNLKRRITDSYISTMEFDDSKGFKGTSIEDSLELISVIARNKRDFIYDKNKIKKILAEHYFEPIQIITLVNNGGTDFLSDELAENYIKTIGGDVEVLQLQPLNMLEVHSPSTVKTALIKYGEIIQNESAKPMQADSRNAIVSYLYEYLLHAPQPISSYNDEDPKIVDKLTSLLCQWYDQSGVEKDKYKIIGCLELLDTENNSQSSVIKSKISNFIAKLSLPFANTLSESALSHYVEKYKTDVLQNLKNDIELMDVWGNKISNDELDEVVYGHIRDDHQIDLVTDRWSRILPIITQHNRMKSVIIDRLDRIKDTAKQKVLKYCETDDFSRDSGIKQKFYDYLDRIKGVNNRIVEVFGRRKYFTKEQKIRLGLLSNS